MDRANRLETLVTQYENTLFRAALAILGAMDRCCQKKSYSGDDLYADEHRRRAAAKESTGGDRK